MALRNYRVFIKYCFFFRGFSKVCFVSLASTRLLLVVQKIPANRSDCTLACVQSFEGGGGVAVNCEKTQFFLNTLYLSFSWNDSAIDLKIKTRNSRNFLYFKAIGVYYTCKKWISYISMNKYV